MAKDYYEVLGVSREATGQEIKKAFRQIARECHPDVSGDDPAAEERFKKARIAYETLMDPVTRARYDRRGQRRSALGKGGTFFDAFYKATGEGAPQPHRPTGGRSKRNDPRNAMDLDDIFNVGDFGFGSNIPKRENAGGAPPPRRERHNMPQPGDDIQVEVDVPATIAAQGGSVTAVYRRRQRSDAWRPGSEDPGLVEVEDIADIRILPNTRNGTVLREKGLGHAGPFGGRYGDLVARVKIVASPPPRTPPRSAPPPPSSPPPSSSYAQPGPSADYRRTTVPFADDGTQVVLLEIGVAEAMLGGRVALDTPQGRVRLTIPPGTSSGTRLRLKGKGQPVDGQNADLYVELRIMVPKTLDDESRRLIEEFARLNP